MIQQDTFLGLIGQTVGDFSSTFFNLSVLEVFIMSFDEKKAFV